MEYRIPVYKISLVRDGSQTVPDKSCNNPAEVSDILQTYLQGTDREHFVVLLLNTKNKIIGINTVSIGNINSSIVHPREVFKPAIAANAAAMIVGHNHPSGIPDPSQNDLDITRRLEEAGQLLGIPVLDHIILGDNTYVSLKEKGVM